MVAAGVYLVARMYPVYLADTEPRRAERGRVYRRVHRALRGTIGIAQNDIKRVLAYSTISQLGYMIMALGVFGYVAGDVPPDDPRVLQGAALPWLGQRDPRHGHAGHPRDGRPAQEDAV